MQAVIMAGGRSTRTHPLTVNRPKPLLKVLDRTLLEHNLDQLQGLVDEVIVIVGFGKDMIIDAFGSSYKGMKLFYAEQKEQLGTGHALQTARQFLKGRFLVINGDDLYHKEDLAALLKHDCGLLVSEVDDVTRFGAVVVDGDKVVKIVEKPSEKISKYVNSGAYVLGTDVFSIDIDKSGRGEYELTDYITALASKGLVRYSVVKRYWLPVGYPWSYLEANVALLREVKEGRIDSTAVVEDDVSMQGVVVIGKNTRIRSGTYIEGPVFIGDDCDIGPGAYMRKDTIIMDNVRTRAELYDVVLMDNVTAKHDCYLAHSVIGDNTNIAAGTITADYRHDGKNQITLVNGQKVDSRRRKLGAFIGENVMTGIGTLIYPGRKIWPNQTTLPGQVVTKDITD
jgi:bifunctional UDP-N-acetylglucosamine pyrophosphorylase/glucosamine-1-phosphate N-acetyltransferase